MLDLSRLRVLLLGEGAAALRRLRLLDEAGAGELLVHAPDAAPALRAAAGGRLVARLPTSAEIAAARLVFIADLPVAERARLAATCHAARVLVHVEDDKTLSEVHAPAVLRRGDLAIAIATGGGSPGLAVQLKHFLGRLFAPEWGDRLDALAARRRRWRAQGAEPETVARRTEEWLSRHGHLPALGAAAADIDAETVRALDALPATRH